MSFFRDISIRNKMLIPPAIMAVALGIVLLLAIYGLDKQSSTLRQVHYIALERTTLVNEFISLSESVQSDIFRISVIHFMGLPDTEIGPIYGHLEEGLVNLRVTYGHILTGWTLDQKEKEILEHMRPPMDAFSHQAQQAVAAVSENPSFGILLVRSATVPFTKFKKELTEFLNYQKEKIAQAETVSRQTVDTIKTATIAVSLFMAFIATLFTVLIGTRLISSPVRSMTEVMGQLAGGDLSAEIGDLSRRDEIGAMADAVEVFRGNAIEKRSVEEALRTSEANYRTIFDTANDAFFIHDLDTGRILDVNLKMLEMYGYTLEEALLNDVEVMSEGVSPYSQKEAAEWTQKAIEGTPQIFEWKARDKSGNFFWVEVNLKRILIQNEDRLLAIVRNITDRKRAESQREAALEALKDSEKRYRELSIVDDLTQLYNSRHFYVQLKIELNRSNRYNEPLTLLMLDLDNFKIFNDSYGHVEGDQVLRRFGQVAKRCLRETDFAYRYGGEEFTISMPMTTSEDGAVIAERIRTEFKEETFSPVPGQDVHMTVSIGLAQYKPQEEMKAFVHRVDQFMYQCKEKGRDQVCWEA